MKAMTEKQPRRPNGGILPRGTVQVCSWSIPQPRPSAELPNAISAPISSMQRRHREGAEIREECKEERSPPSRRVTARRLCVEGAEHERWFLDARRDALLEARPAPGCMPRL